MKICYFMIALLLAGCGGSSSTSGSSTPPPAAQPPAQSANAVPLASQTINITTDQGDYLIQSVSVVDVTVGVSNNQNKLDFSQNQAANQISIGGNQNILIFRPGTSVANLSITGEMTRVWVPVGSTIAAAGIPPTSTDWRTYTP